MKNFYFLFLFGFFQLGFSQLSNFSLQVTPTNETCAGNGALSFSVSNTTVGASILYEVFLLPNTTTPIATTSNALLTGLSSGNYQVVAVQTLGAESNTQQQNVTITNQIQNLAFTISHQVVKCGNDGVLTANVTSGTAVSYELLTGPVTMPVQSSNTFSGLPPGNYAIRVFDTCGNAVVNSFTLIQNYVPVVIQGISEQNLTCTTLTLNGTANIITGSVAFPLSVEYKVYPPNNATPLIYTQIISGPTALGIQQIIPRYDGDYYFDLKIIDACGNSTASNHNLINMDFGFTVINIQGCAPKINVAPYNVVYPYTIEFVTMPAGFNPSAVNPGYPGPYYDPETELNVIVGNYNIKVTDACLKTQTINFEVTDEEVPILSSASNDGCGGISFSIDSVYEVTMVNVTLISAPAAYQGVLPENLSIYIGSGGYIWSQVGFPPGNYVFQILDSCGDLHTQNVTLNTGQTASMGLINYPDCDIDNASVYVYYLGTNIVTVNLINAPANFPHPLPYAITPASSTAFALISVPAGSYTVQMTTTCGNIQTNTFTIQSGTNYNTTFELEQFCSSFNLRFSHQGNNSQTTYALQKLNEITGNWEHPITGNQIIGNVINAGNFYPLTHNSWNINLTFNGKFRIIKAFSTINSQVCVQPIKEFEVINQPKVLNHNVINCGNGFAIVELNAVGIGQLNYRITQKNNQPFTVNNGNNNVFLNLEPAIYNFQIEDSCGNILNVQIQINTSFPIQITANLCENQTSSLYVANYPILQYEWWKDGAPANILSTTNVLSFNPFVNAVHAGTYKLRITHVGNPTSCLNSVLTYTIGTQAAPNAGLDAVVNLCGMQNSINLNSYLTGSFDTTGTWEEITSSNSLPINGIWNASAVAYGQYKFKYTVLGFCSSSDESIITININEKPVIASLPNQYSLCKGEDLVIDSGLNNPNYVYQWTGPNSFSSTNTLIQFVDIQAVSNGQYTLVVSNNGCQSDPYTFVIEVTSVPDFLITESCENNIKTLTAIPFEGTFDATLNFTWTGPNGFSGFENPIQIPTGNIGDYELTIEKNTCEITEGINVTSTTCEVPKGVSPNGDGLNDSFDLSEFDVRTLKIFNRYGMVVYSKENGYANEWYGQADNGNILPDATYYYVAHLNSGESKVGWVYVTR